VTKKMNYCFCTCEVLLREDTHPGGGYSGRILKSNHVTKKMNYSFCTCEVLLRGDTHPGGGINIKGDVDFVLFFSQAFGSVEFMDFMPAFIKSFFFGAVIGFVGCYKGYHAGRGTESVGLAANSAVVLGSLLVIIVDVIAVQITDMLI
jgi:hypothetical protein